MELEQRIKAHRKVACPVETRAATFGVCFDKSAAFELALAAGEVLMRAVWACVAGLGLVLSSCGRMGGLESKGAVQAAIEAHLKQRPNVVLANMTLEVQDVKFSADRAEAEVKFRSKQSPELAVSVHYVLRKAGDHWEVESSSSTSRMGATPHGGAEPSAPSTAPSEETLQRSH